MKERLKQLVRLRPSRKTGIALAALLVVIAGAGTFYLRKKNDNAGSSTTAYNSSEPNASFRAPSQSESPSAQAQTSTPPPTPTFVKAPDARPDALILTQSLSELPRDILKQPILKEVLSEDFVFYYEESPDYLSLKGSLKRIAFEHELTLFDQVLSLALRAPAELALWKSFNGRLEDFMLVLDRTIVGDLLTKVAKLATSDKQLSLLPQGERKDDLAIYKFQYSFSKALYFTATKTKLVVFSHPEMPIPSEERLKQWQRYAGEPTGKHSLVFSMGFLSFGYQTFFPTVDALRFGYQDNDGWTTQALLTKGATLTAAATQNLWRALPKSPSTCAALPVSPESLKQIAEKVKAANIVANLKGPLAICWYADSKLYSPVLVAKAEGAVDKKALRKVFEASVGGFEAGLLSATPAIDDENAPAPRAAQFEKPLPVVETSKAEGTVLSREVSSRWGIYPAKKSKHAKKMRSNKYFNVRLALYRGYLVFSPDDRLVDQVLSVIDKKFPALADALPDNESFGFILYPEKLAELLKQSSLDTLPAEQESVFRESVARNLFPAFDRMRKVSAVSASFPEGASDKQRWEELKWRGLSSN